MDVNTVSFADGHAELHKWTDPAIMAVGQGAAQRAPPLDWVGPTSGADDEYVFKGYRFRGHP